MSCCVGFEDSKALIENIVKVYHPTDYKIFVAHRYAIDHGTTYKVRVGVVVKPDVDLNTSMFEDFIKLHARSDACIKVLSSEINFKENRLADLFLLEIESEVNG